MKLPFLWATTQFMQEGWLPTSAGPSSTVGVSLAAAAAGLVLWFLILCWLGGKGGRFRMEVNIQKQHYIQAFCHFCIYVYLGLYWKGVGNYAPLIAAQILFAYCFEMLLSWSRGRVWQIRLGPLPIVFSINFFMWFREPYFYLQLLMIAMAYLIKEYITWTWDGRKRHIFNPSGITLTIVGLLLLGTDTNTKLTHGYDLATAFYLPPNLYEVIFLLGLIVMYNFSITLITLGSFIALWVLFGVTDLSSHAVDVYVFLGLTFLLTDPSTSPCNKGGKFLFGLAYGGLIFVSYVILWLMDQPPYYDKIFPVPILNLLAPRFQVLGERFEGLLKNLGLPYVRYDWAIYLSLYAGTFSAFLWACKAAPEEFISPLPALTPSKHSLSSPMTERLVQQNTVKAIYPEAFAPFAFRQEIAHFQDLRDFAPQTPLEHDRYGKMLVTYGNAERGLVHFRQALATDPSYAAAHLDIGDALLRDRKPDEALEHLRQADALNPMDSNTQLSLGLALSMQGQLDKGILHLQQAVKLNPASADACVRLGQALMANGRMDDAAASLRQALAHRPRDRKARQLLDELEGHRSQNFALPTQDQRKG